ncbi:MAG TPA: creatininase family protein [Bacilli bacterium]|jgi:creatinine amidohydrolase|nr:MAG: Creatinine amidohydrolase [Tenericutes bacterium ADurb.Bin140]HON64413.1 creatininase family protein [Bacilli bacterium]HOR96694.1 creatininase family protein [Bacilli bacterium]HPD12568.1 creatininase family protein [Bacilli bacterium]HPK58801.1 creatininase family protein [Bacilli bacterium]
MNWENLTSKEFAQAVKETGVCIVAFGVIERHGDHLPLGTDFLNGHKLATLAAQKESAVVFPPFYFGQIYEARCFPGTVTISPRLLIDLIQGVLDEIGRNGFKKIILFNAHGGNAYLLPFLAQCQLWEEKPYQVYYYQGDHNPDRIKKRNSLWETPLHGHACECETSKTLYLHRNLVKMDQIPAGTTEPLGRLNHLPSNFSGLTWYSNYPNHYVGDAQKASYEKGKQLVALEVEALVEFIKAVKADKVLPLLAKDFHERVKKLSL